MKKIDDCRVIAHRGASAEYPENTMLAFENAVKMEAHMLEFDISFTLDKEIVVIHDETVDRTTNGKGKVQELNYNEIKQLDAGDGQRIPLFEDVLKRFANRIPMNIEIKTESVSDDFKNGIEETAIELVKKYSIIDSVVFSSFDPRAIRHVKQGLSQVKTAYLYEKKWWNDKDPLFIVTDLNADYFNCSNEEINDDWIELLTSNSIPINVYTVDDPDRMEDLFKKGVSGIFSNKPDLLLKVYKRVTSS